jgi:hypothetical protein
VKILIGINTLTMIDSQVYGNHMAWFYHLGRLREQKGWEIILYTPWRFSIDRMRNEAAKMALENECDYLMFVDDDMLVQLDTLEKLIEADKDIIMAHTYIRGYPFHPMCFKNFSEIPNDIQLKPYDDVIKDKGEDGLTECDAVGFACCLIKCSMLKRLEQPYFVTTPNATEDVYFCLRCKIELGREISIFVDTRCPTGHAMDKEFVHEKTVHAHRAYVEALNEKPEESKKREDRGTEYHKGLEIVQ